MEVWLTGSMSSNEPQQLLLSVPDAADCLGVSEGKMRQMIRDGLVPTIRLGRSVRVSVKDLVRMIEERKQLVAVGAERRTFIE